MRTLLIAMIICASALAGCELRQQEPGATDIARAKSLRPDDPQLAERYERSCMTCHAVRDSGAPLAGFAPQWTARLDKGMEQLVSNTRDGFNAMPARGLCNDCSHEDLRALIRFMSGNKT